MWVFSVFHHWLSCWTINANILQQHALIVTNQGVIHLDRDDLLSSWDKYQKCTGYYKVGFWGPQGFSCQTPNHNSTQPQFNIRLWLRTPPHPTTHRNSMFAISQLLLTQFLWNFKCRLWEHLKQIPTVTVTFVWATFVLGTFVHKRNISAVPNLILTKL